MEKIAQAELIHSHQVEMEDKDSWYIDRLYKMPNGDFVKCGAGGGTSAIGHYDDSTEPGHPGGYIHVYSHAEAKDWLKHVGADDTLI